MFWGDKYENLEPLHLGKNGEILQFFTAVIDGESDSTFVVNHQVFPSATSAIMADRKAGLDVPSFDYVRSATKQEAAAFVQSLTKQGEVNAEPVTSAERES